MITTLTIDGVAKNYQLGSFRLSRTANGRAAGTLAVRSLDATYRPDTDVDVVVEEDALPLIGGLVSGVRERGAAPQSGVAIISEIDVVDYNVYPDFRIVSRTFAAGTLEAFLTIIVDEYLDVYGVTLDAGQVTGPNLPELLVTTQKLTDLLNDVMAMTAEFGEPYVWRIDEDKVLSAFQPTNDPAPFDIEDPLPIAEVRSDITVETRRGPTYANRVIVYVPPITELNRVETFTGDGSEDTFELQYTPSLFTRGVIVNAGADEPIGPGSGYWEYDSITNTITRTRGAPANGATIEAMFNGTFSVNVSAEDAGEIAAIGLREKLIMPDMIPSTTTGQSIADAELAKSIFPITTVRYTTLESGLVPGMSQLVNVARRNVNATGVITDVVSRDLGKNEIQHEVTVMIDGSLTNLGRGWRDTYKRWDFRTNLSRTTGGVSVGTTPGTGTAAGDSYAVKGADSTINNTITPADVPDLAFPVEADAIYIFEAWIFHTAETSASDLRVSFSVPSGTTMWWGTIGTDQSAWGGGNTLVDPAQLFTQAQDQGIGTTDSTPGGGAEVPSGFVLLGKVDTAGTAGTVQMRWRQGAADASNNVIKAHSFIRYRRIQ